MRVHKVCFMEKYVNLSLNYSCYTIFISGPLPSSLWAQLLFPVFQLGVNYLLYGCFIAFRTFFYPFTSPKPWKRVLSEKKIRKKIVYSNRENKQHFCYLLFPQITGLCRQLKLLNSEDEKLHIGANLCCNNRSQNVGKQKMNKVVFSPERVSIHFKTSSCSQRIAG